MGKLGGFLIVIGAGSYILPMMGRQFILMSVFPENIRPYAGAGVIAVGIVLLVLGLKGKKKEEKK